MEAGPSDKDLYTGQNSKEEAPTPKVPSIGPAKPKVKKGMYQVKIIIEASIKANSLEESAL